LTKRANNLLKQRAPKGAAADAIQFLEEYAAEVFPLYPENQKGAIELSRPLLINLFYANED
jgi:hypothetical protein